MDMGEVGEGEEGEFFPNLSWAIVLRCFLYFLISGLFKTQASSVSSFEGMEAVVVETDEEGEVVIVEEGDTVVAAVGTVEEVEDMAVEAAVGMAVVEGEEEVVGMVVQTDEEVVVMVVVGEGAEMASTATLAAR